MGDWVGGDGSGGGKKRGAGAGETGGFVEEEGGVMCLEVEEVYSRRRLVVSRGLGMREGWDGWVGGLPRWGRCGGIEDCRSESWLCSILRYMVVAGGVVIEVVERFEFVSSGSRRDRAFWARICRRIWIVKYSSDECSLFMSIRFRASSIWEVHGRGTVRLKVDEMLE